MTDYYLFEIKLPIPGNPEMNNQRFIEIEEFYKSLGAIFHAQKSIFNSAAPYVVFEIAAPKNEDKIGVYAALPKNFIEIIKRQLMGFFPKIHIEPADNFEIFGNKKCAAGSVLKLKNANKPFQTYKTAKNSLTNAIVESISALTKKTDGAVLQVLIKPIERSSFETNIRIAASAATTLEAEELLSDIEDAFSQFDLAESNSFYGFRPRGAEFKKFIRNFAFRLFNEKEKITLTSEQLASIFHWPYIESTASKLEYLKTRPLPPPSAISNSGVILGDNLFKNQITTIRLGALDRRHHLFVAGLAGGGRDRFLKNLIKQDMDGGAGIGIIDYGGGFADFATGIAPRWRRKDITLSNGDETRKIVDDDINDIMDNGKIFIAGKSSPKNHLIGRFNDAVLKRIEKNSRIPNRDFYLYIIDSDGGDASLASKIMSETEKSHNLNIILTGQVAANLADFASIVAFRSDIENAKILSEYFHPVFRDADLINIDENCAYTRLTIDGGLTTLFGIEIKELFNK